MSSLVSLGMRKERDIQELHLSSTPTPTPPHPRLVEGGCGYQSTAPPARYAFPLGGPGTNNDVARNLPVSRNS